MSVIGSNILAGASGQGGGYNLTNSLRFRSSASAYLNRTPSVAATSTTKGTISIWFKGIGQANQYLVGKSSGTIFYLYFNSSNQLVWQNGGVNTFITTQVFRDPSSWYHLVASWDTTQATSSNRQSLYLNGQQITAFGTTNNLGLNATVSWFDNDGNNRGIGTYISGGYFDGYMAEINAIDGQALTPSSFGETSSTTGVWIPKKYTGTYGTNGFYLPFTDNSALTTSSNVGLGKDFSGNANYWTTNNISITSGSTYDSMTDVPTLTSATTANYAVLNPLQTTQSASAPTNANLTSPANAGAWRRIGGSMQLPTTGKFYFEYTCDSFSTFATFSIGVFSGNIDTGNNVIGTSATEWGYNGQSGYASNNSSNISSGFTTATTGDVLQLAYDASTGSLWFGKNNTWQGASSPNPSTGTSPTYTGVYNITPVMVQNWATQSANFGQRPFAYTPPTNFNRLNTFNLPTPTIGATASTQANRNFDVVTRNGFGSSGGSVTSLNFQPDFWWEKARSTASNHTLIDSIRGVTKELYSNLTNAESTGSNFLTSFNSNGFTMGSNDWGTSTTLVDWVWKAGGTAVTNTNGSITSTVSVNASAGFSIATYTGTGSAGATVGHGLGIAAKMVIVKERGNANVWGVGSSSLTSWAYHVRLNSSNAESNADNFWNSTAPTSSVFTLGDVTAVNRNGGTYVAYCWAEIAGFSKFGSYTGNGSSDGPFIFTGFRPRFVMFKSTGIENWIIHDTARDTYNVSGSTLIPNVADSEYSNNQNMDILSNGVKMRSTNDATNTNGVTYTYMAFAENPFKYANAR